MIIEGTHRIEGASAESVFDALVDPAVLARALPGCRSLVDRGGGVYEVSVDVGIASAHANYQGTVQIRDQRRPHFYEAGLETAGASGSVSASMRAELADGGDGTEVAYRIDAKVAGRIAGVGQRVVAGVARRNASAFIAALERELTGAGVPAPPAAREAPPPPPLEIAGPPPPIAESEGGPARAPVRAFASGVAVGLVLAVLGLRLRRRSRR